MNNLFNHDDVQQILGRINNLSPETERKWGKMNPAQMMEHCSMALDTAIGKHKIPRLFIGRIIGTMMKKSVVGPKPFGKNSPTDKSYKITSEINFDQARTRLTECILKFSEGGPKGCTTHPHPFFGKFTPEQWAVFEWKHLDHHLRQFGV